MKCSIILSTKSISLEQLFSIIFRIFLYLKYAVLDILKDSFKEGKRSPLESHLGNHNFTFIHLTCVGA